MKYKKYKKFLDELKKKGVISIKNDSFIDRIELWHNEEYYVEEDHINYYLPVIFNPDVAFGFNVNTDKNDDYINIYLNYYPNTDTDNIEMIICYLAKDDDFCVDVLLTEAQKERIKEVIKKESVAAYGGTPQDLYEKFYKEVA